ncbi:ATP-dependent RNA helicase [Melia azedarach]|uniref:ATP-dependent RNA helicase n=2 Tax=Melia azedarach TaxID=155640 RepID=A0ACC1YVL1_MELAZ|nr:ATP-dependent RNA helicase [Melia azedarach]KAJ4727734.1 ATP-dependent RNA helicase [Melia azedarach]
MAKGKQRREAKRGQDSCSSEAVDSNAMILPANKTNQKKKHVNKEQEKTISKEYPNHSKSQLRKLKKLEEEKQRAYMSIKAQENLEKYKISTGLYNVLEASKDMGKVQTRREKKRNAMQLAKEGLEDPQSDQTSKRRHEVVVNKEVLDDASVSLASLPEPVPSNAFGTNDEPVNAEPSEEVSNKDSDKSMQQDIKNGTEASSIHDGGENSKSMDGFDNSLRVNSDLPSSLHRPLMAPMVVHVSRPNEVENKRKDLPIVMMEQEIMEAVNDNPAVIICGETGCGKTTQVPQFLHEAGFGSKQCTIRSGIIGVTQPRRVAVLATAKRVAFELGLHLGKEVGFQVRHDKKIGDNCSIKFMTDGILLRELKYDVLLRQYSVIILDEAHERSLNTDILIGMLSRIIQPRQALYEKQQQLLLSGQEIEPKDRVFPLKIILMSATLRVEDFISGRRLFCNPPIIEVPTRQFPVTVHFSKRTEIVDYIGQAYKKVMSIHKRLPQGGILVFVTGQREVESLCCKLRKASKELIANTSRGNMGSDIVAVSEPNSIEGISMKEINEAFGIHGNSTDDQQTDRLSSYDEDQFDFDEDESDASYDSETESEAEIVWEDGNSVELKTPKDGGDLVDMLGENLNLASLKVAFDALAGKNTSDSSAKRKPATPTKPEQCSEILCPVLEKMEDNKGPCVSAFCEENKGRSVGALCVLPLYAMLPAAAQLRVFEEVKEGERLVVVATNVAETSLTIPGIKYVVDTGREKVKNYNSANGIESYEIQWISKASAAQRAGRAGRTGPGHCYRLYSSAVFNNILPDFSCAEISKVPVDGVVLLMKSMNIDKVANFPFPTPPEATALVEAERCLKALEALDSNGRLTTLGKAMAHYPMSPRHSRMLLTLIKIMKGKSYARANLVLAYAVAAAAALSLSNPFAFQLEESQTNGDDLEQDERSNVLDSKDLKSKQEKLRKKKLREVAKVVYAKFSNPTSDVLTVAYALQCFELSKCSVEFCNENVLNLKTMEEMSKLRKQLLHLVFNQNVICDQEFSWIHGTLHDVENSWRISSSKNILLQNEEELLCRAICAGWADRVAKRIRLKSGSLAGDRKVNAVRYQACMVKEDVFLHLRSSVANTAPEFLVYSELLYTKRPYMHGATRVKADWLVEYARPLCSFSESFEGSKYFYDCHKDQVLCWVNPIFGAHQWELPLHCLPVSREDEHRVAVFACALLEGQVLPCLRHVQKFMAAHPNTILKLEQSGNRRVGKLLNKLKARSIDSCALLKKAWEENPRALHSEILEWFQKSFHDRFEELWSKMLAEVCLEPQQRFAKEKREDERKK